MKKLSNELDLEPRTIAITARSYIQVGTLVSVLLFAVSATWWFAKFDQRLTNIERSITQRWTAQDMHIFVLQFKNLNPTLIVPSIEQIMLLRNNTVQ